MWIIVVIIILIWKTKTIKMLKHSTLVMFTILFLIVLMKMLKLLIVQKLHPKKIILLSIFHMIWTISFSMNNLLILFFLIYLWKLLIRHLIKIIIIDWKKSDSLLIRITIEAILHVIVIISIFQNVLVLKHLF